MSCVRSCRCRIASSSWRTDARSRRDCRPRSPPILESSRPISAGGVMALLEVVGLCAGYGDVPVLRGIDLSIPAGSITTLIGANGAGKTTLLRAISGIIPTEAGTVHYDGKDVAGMPPQDIVRGGLVQVPEGRRLFPDMTVHENLLVGSSSPVARPKRDENLAMVLELFPKVRARRNQLAGTLSGGEQQMVAIARALMASPRLLLLDETSLGLAPIVVDEIFVAVRRLAARGLSILVVEQNTALALEVADYGYVLEQGRFAIQGAASSLAADPRVKQAYLGI